MGLKRISIGLAVLVGCITSCTWQFDPTGDWKKFKEERDTAHRMIPTLTEEGKIPATGEGQPVASAEETYAMLCASCHGKNGAGDGPGGAGLEPKPRAFNDKAWQASRTDEAIRTVIAKGGTAAGMSAAMVGWESMLNDAQLDAMVGLVRKFGP